MKKTIYTYLFYVCLTLGSLSVLTSCSSDGDESPQNNDGNNGGNDQNVGVSAQDFLTSDTYSNLVVEIQYASGYEPPQGAVNNLQSLLNERLNKPGGVSITTTEIAAPGQDTYSTADLRAIEDNNRTQFTNGNTIAAYFFFADGGFSQDTENSKILGVAYRNTSMALFQETIENNSGGVGQPSTSLLTSTVMNHEFGHILGLVNNGTPVQSDHHDAANGAHCDVEDCLMYWQAETSGGLGDLVGMSSPPPLDPQCIDDLQANGGK